ncbi:MAG: hypothetical protein RLZZ282_182 [Verrucomicrobiota bacterium]
MEDGVAAKTICAYIDLNPVRAGMVKDPADYRWSSYGEAIGGGAKGNGKTARAGLLRALRAHQGVVADAGLWTSGVSREYRKLLMAGASEKTSHCDRGTDLWSQRDRPVVRSPYADFSHLGRRGVPGSPWVHSPSRRRVPCAYQKKAPPELAGLI